MFLNLFSGVALAEVNGDAADFFGLCETFWDTVYDVDLGCTTKNGRVGGHETYWACAEDGDRLAGFETRELDAVPALIISNKDTSNQYAAYRTHRWEYVRKESKIVLVLFTGREL